MHSITYRITGLMFLLVAAAVSILTFLANWQMTNHFTVYLDTLSNGGFMGNMPGHMMGTPEETFLTSVHRSLGWVGLGILLIGLAASYALARSITVPLLRLHAGVQQIKKGDFRHTVAVTTKDEIAALAEAFNDMAMTLDYNNRQRQRLLTDIAHELKTPLAVIQGNLEGMLDGVVPADKEQLGSLYEETVHLNHLIRDLRDLSLAEAGQLKLDKTDTNVEQLLAHAIAMLRPLTEEKKITLTAEFTKVPPVQADPMRLSQVVYNLLTNAIRYTGHGGQIRVSTGSDDKWLEMVVEDNGQGIAKEDLPHIFDHFYRADKSRSRGSGGTGIGLSIVKQIIELHGGRVEVASSVGKGTRFTVFLPHKTEIG